MCYPYTIMTFHCQISGGFSIDIDFVDAIVWTNQVSAVESVRGCFISLSSHSAVHTQDIRHKRGTHNYYHSRIVKRTFWVSCLYWLYQSESKPNIALTHVWKQPTMTWQRLIEIQSRHLRQYKPISKLCVTRWTRESRLLWQSENNSVISCHWLAPVQSF